MSQSKRQRFCRRYPHGDGVGVEKRDRTANFTGLQTCANVWTCPCCGPKIAVERAADIALAITEHYARGGRVALLTLTLPHSRADRLNGLVIGLSKAWASIRQNKTPRRLMGAHVHGFVRRLEVTVGPSGWHPHLHVLLFLVPGVSKADADQLADSIFRTWAGRLGRLGHGQANEAAFDFRPLTLGSAHEKVAEYVAKSAAFEVATAGGKVGRSRNRTPMQLLADIGRYGLADDVARWHEYEAAMKGRQQLRWSDGLRDQLLPGLDELTDDEAAEANDGAARLLCCLGAGTWQAVTDWRHGPAPLLTVAELYDDDDEAREAIARLLDRHGLGRILEAGSQPAQRSTY